MIRNLITSTALAAWLAAPGLSACAQTPVLDKTPYVLPPAPPAAPPEPTLVHHVILHRGTAVSPPSPPPPPPPPAGICQYNSSSSPYDPCTTTTGNNVTPQYPNLFVRTGATLGHPSNMNFAGVDVCVGLCGISVTQHAATAPAGTGFGQMPPCAAPNGGGDAIEIFGGPCHIWGLILSGVAPWSGASTDFTGVVIEQNLISTDSLCHQLGAFASKFNGVIQDNDITNNSSTLGCGDDVIAVNNGWTIQRNYFRDGSQHFIETGLSEASGPIGTYRWNLFVNPGNNGPGPHAEAVQTFSSSSVAVTSFGFYGNVGVMDAPNTYPNHSPESTNSILLFQDGIGGNSANEDFEWNVSFAALNGSSGYTTYACAQGGTFNCSAQNFFITLTYPTTNVIVAHNYGDSRDVTPGHTMCNNCSNLTPTPSGGNYDVSNGSQWP